MVSGCPLGALLLRMYHEAFWVAVSASAPVIALAAVVALGGVFSLAWQATEWNIDHDAIVPKKSDYGRAIELLRKRFNRAVSITRWTCMANTILQAAMLAFALTSLAARIDELPAALTIAAEALGIIAMLMAGIYAADAVRSHRDSMVLRMGQRIGPKAWRRLGLIRPHEPIPERDS